jgi:hypothetical protein
MRDGLHFARDVAVWGGSGVVVLGTLLTSAHSVVSLAFYYLLFVVLYRVTVGRGDVADITCVTGVFAFYALATLVLYWTQLLALPEYFGFSGGLGVGTDDHFFYSLAAPKLPEGFPLRTNFFLSDHTYGVLLRVFSEPMYLLYGDLHPLDLLFMNSAGLSLMPFFVRGTARLATDDEAASRWAFALSLICPVMMANGVILIRDGLTATLFIAAVYGLVASRFALMFAALLGAAFLRPAQAVMLLGSLWMLAMFAWLGARNLQGPLWRPTGLTVTGLLLAPLLIAPLAYVLFGATLIEKLLAVKSLFRESFLYDFLREQALRDGGPDTFYAINQLALPVRLPLAFAFYFGAPYLALETFAGPGPVVPRQVLTALFGVLFVAYGGFFVKGAIRAWDTVNAVVLGIVITYCVDLLILSQASMQTRHKTALLPLMYIVVAYGMRYRQRDAVILGLCFSFGLGAMELLYNAYKLSGH